MATKNLGRVGMKPQGEYNSEQVYEELDIVKSGGSSYVSRKNNNTSPLSEEENWMLIAEGASFEDLTPEQVQELQQPAIDAAQSVAAVVSEATLATTNANTSAGTAQDAAILANAAAANNAMRYNDATDTLAPDVIRRVDEGTKIEQEYKQTPTNIDGIAITDAMVDGFAYLKRGVQYFMNSDFAIKREVYLDSYGLPGDGIFRKISELFPNVTLTEVQAFNPIATLDNSADWYILMKLNRDLPVNSTVYLTGKYVIDLEITWRRSSITWKGAKYKYSSKYQSDKVPSITQISEGEHCIAIRDGDGVTNDYGSKTQILNVYFEDFNIIGTKTVDVRSGHGIFIDIPLGDMVFSHFKNVKVVNHGKSGLYHTMGHMNEVYWYDCQMYGNFDTGIWLDGKPSSQTNLLGFKYCGFGTNGFVIDAGVLRPYDYTIDGIDYTKGGISVGNLSSTNFESLNTQSNHGFGFMAREGAAFAGVEITAGYSEMNPLGDWVILCHLDSHFTMNVGSLYDVAIYPNLITGSNYFSVFKSLDHYRKFVPYVGVQYNKDLHERPWSENLIPDSKNRVPGVVGGVFERYDSFDEYGSRITTIEQTGGSGSTYIEWMNYPEYNRPPYVLEEGDLVVISFDIKFSLITGSDISNFGGGQYGVMRYFDTSLNAFGDSPTTDGEWKRISFTYEHKGTYASNQAPRPFLYIAGVNDITFSTRNPEFKIKSRKPVFMEGATNATPLLKGVVNQAAAVSDSTAVDITEINTKYNELLTKLRAAGIVAM